MSPQFVDFDGDGDEDIVCGIYDGSPHVSYWDHEREGYLPPVGILDRSGDRIVMNAWWNFAEKKWDRTDRCNPEGGAPEEGHLTSAIAFDYDRDGDFDLVLGDHRGGFVYLRRNEGTDSAPKFATKNELVMAAGAPMRDAGTVATIRSVDWNSDGVLDLMVSGMGDPYGDGRGAGVAVYLNRTERGESDFGAPNWLVTPSTKNAAGAPERPDVGLHADAVDFDGDGDLDLIVGGYSVWDPRTRAPTTVEAARADQLEARIAELNARSSEIYRTAETAGEGLDAAAAKALIDEVQPKLDELRSEKEPLQRELEKLRPRRQRASFTWLYENLTK